MKKFIFAFVFLTACSYHKTVKTANEFPVIDIGSIAGNYKRVYCSDYFSSIELIPLETNANSLILLDFDKGLSTEESIKVNDSLIFILSEQSQSLHIILPIQRSLLVFDRSGKFLRQIGRLGQGPGDLLGIDNFIINHEKPTVFIYDYRKIVEYEFSGKFINSFFKPSVDENILGALTYFADDIFIVSVKYRHKNTNKHFLFNRDGNLIKSFPSWYYYESDIDIHQTVPEFFPTFRTEEGLFIKDEVNDTIYSVDNLNLQPFCVFDFGKFSIPTGQTNEEGMKRIMPVKPGFISGIRHIVGTPNYFFYTCYLSSKVSKPKGKPVLFHGAIEVFPALNILGIYDRVRHTNTLLDTDHHLQRGLINDINGGLPVIPKYYAGNKEIVDVWNAGDMFEILTEKYFSEQKIKDLQAHEKLKELLKTLKEDDNPVVVIATLKD